jgi:hypothetical protein
VSHVGTLGLPCIGVSEPFHVVLLFLLLVLLFGINSFQQLMSWKAIISYPIVQKQLSSIKLLFLFIIMLFQNINHNSSVQVITLDMGLLVAGTKYRGEFEERLKKLMEEIKQNDDIILFIDEVHTLIGAGAAEGAIDAANILKPALARGELQVMSLILNSIAAIVMKASPRLDPDTLSFHFTSHTSSKGHMSCP